MLRSIDLDIAPGEFVALLGRSGCGKSTLLRSLARLDPTPAGEVEISGRTSVAFQEPRLLPWRTVHENVALALLNGPERKQRFELAEQTLAEVGLAEKLDAWPLQLSGGQAQRVSLARALVSNPALMLLDEPFSALDALTRIEMHQLVIELWRRHSMAILIVTHDVDEAIALADRVAGHGRRPDRPRVVDHAPRRDDRAPVAARDRPDPRRDARRARRAAHPRPTRTATRSRTKEQHEPHSRTRRRTKLAALGAVLARRDLRSPAAAATPPATRAPSSDDGIGRPLEGDPDRRRPEGRLEGAAPGRRPARRRRLHDRVEGVHLRTAAARGAERRRHPRRRRRQHPAALRGRRRRARSRSSRARRTAAPATRSWCRPAPPSRTSPS